MAWRFTTEYKDSKLGTYWTPRLASIESEQQRFKAMGQRFADAIEAEYMAGPRDRDTPGYPDFGSSDVAPLLDGWRWPVPEEPFRAQLVKHEGELVDITESTFGSWAVSRKVIDLIEAIEPGVHQYLPFELVQPDGSVHPDRRWLLNVCTRAEVIDTERSNVAWLSGMGTRRIFSDGPGRPRLIARAAEASKLSLWFEWRYMGAGPATFASDRLWDMLRTSNILGWGAHHNYGEQVQEA